MKACIACDAPKGADHKPWCPVVTGTLETLRVAIPVQARTVVRHESPLVIR